MKRFGIALLSGIAALSVPASITPVQAEDVTINLDALGKPEPAKTKPAKQPAPPAPTVKSPPLRPDAVRSEIVPDDPVESPPKPVAARPAPAAKPVAAAKPPVAPAAPKLAAKPATAKPVAAKQSAAKQPGEIDFISKTKRKSGGQGQSAAIAAPANAVQGEPLSPPSDGSLDGDAAPAAMALPAAKPQPPKAAPAKPVVTPASVKVDDGALEQPASAQSGRPSGTPLTSVAPDGVLYVPKNTSALPQPVSAPPAAEPSADEEESKPLTLPPSMPEAPPRPSTAVDSSRPSAAIETPRPAATAVAAVSPAAMPAVAAGTSATLARASVLSGFATASELKFEAGQDALTAEAQSALDQLAQSLKAAGMRVQLAAYSGPPGNNSSDARRLSLKRALAVREYLAAQGVQKLMVNIAAFGGPAIGATDRVDVMVRSDQVSKAGGQ